MGLFTVESLQGGGGFLDGQEGTIIDAAWVYYDYQGNRPDEVPAFHLLIEVEDWDEPVAQYWSCGKLTDWAPTEDGLGIKAIGKRTGFHETSNIGLLIKSFANAGMPPAVLSVVDTNAKALVGTKIRWMRAARGKDSKSTVLLVDAILNLPDEGIDAKAEAAELMLKMLGDNDGTIKRRSLPAMVTKYLEGYDPDEAKAIKTVIMAKGFLDEGPAWVVSGSEITLA